jgi:hypothetical protein
VIRRAAAVAAVLLASQVPAPVHVGRAFTVRAEAYPVESAPGTRETEVAVRQLSTVAQASNPPPDAFARATANDMGLAEAYVGQQGPSADADTATAGGQPDVVVEEGGSRLEAHVEPAPRARADAAGNTASGTGSSTSTADGAGEELVATATAEINDVVIGPLVIGSGRFDATATANGQPGGATASGVVRTSDATFADIPVTIGSDGLQLDESRVPDALVGPSTAALQQAFSEGGYADIRVVQPRVEVAEDGSSASVSGGGVYVFLTNNSPTERYFVSHTLLGGSVEVSFGGELAVPSAAPAAVPAEPATVDGPAAPAGASDPTPVAGPAAPPAAAPPAAPDLAYDAAGRRVTLPVVWPGWIWFVVAIGIAWAAAGVLRLPFAAGARARLRHAGDGFADRYLRG